MWYWVVILLMLTRTSSSGVPLHSRDHLGSPGDLAWQAWLLVDSKTSSSVERRIIPKSVFIAPGFSVTSLPACAEGYRADAMGRCVKLVRVNQAAQLDFLLQQLNSMYASPAASTNPGDDPLKVNLPIASSNTEVKPSDASEEQKGDDDEPFQVSVVVADLAKRSSENETGDEEPGSNQEPVITLWSVDNNTLPKKEDMQVEETIDPIPTEEKPDKQSSVPVKSTDPPSTEVLAPANVEDSLPMIVISPGTSDGNADNDTAVVTYDATSEADKSSVKRDESLLSFESENDNIPQTSLSTGANSDVKEDTYDSYQRSEVEDMRYRKKEFAEDAKLLPLLMHGNENLKAADPIPIAALSVLKSDGGAAPSRTFIRFPSEVKEEPESFPKYKGTFVKFPTEESSQHKIPKFPPVLSSRLSEDRPLWWLPDGWRLDHRQYQPAMVKFWSRMPRSDNLSWLSRYRDSRPDYVRRRLRQD